jgi:hypothetical protein
MQGGPQLLGLPPPPLPVSLREPLTLSTDVAHTHCPPPSSLSSTPPLSPPPPSSLQLPTPSHLITRTLLTQE